MIIIGDLAFNGIICSQQEKNRERYKDIAHILKNEDVVFANLEVPIKIRNTINEYKKVAFYSDYKTTSELLSYLNISCVSLANNHIYDCKMDGLKATINLLDNLEIYHTGAGWKNEHIKPVIFDKAGIRYGFLAYVDKNTNPKTEYFDDILINYFETEIAKEEIESLKEKVDFVICSIHWGVDFSHYPTIEQMQSARILVDAGADVIMGHHTHTIQPYEKRNTGLIFYSLGGVSFGDYYQNGKLKAIRIKSKVGLMIQIHKDKTLKPIVTKELKGNYVKIFREFNYLKWSKQKMKTSELIAQNKHFKLLVRLKEDFLDRVYQYFFGYYQNPVKRLFEIKNISKIKKLFQ